MNRLSTAGSSIINVYLADIRENRKLRSNDRFKFNGTVPSESQAPARLDCHYLITAWSPDQGLQDGENVMTEHRLLYSAAAALLRHNPIVARHVFGDIPVTIDALNDDPKSNYHNTVAAANPLLRAFYSLDPVIRDLELPVDVMPPEGFHRIGEFWGLMGSGAIWHPSAYVIVTLPIERLRGLRAAGAIHRRDLRPAKTNAQPRDTLHSRRQGLHPTRQAGPPRAGDARRDRLSTRAPAPPASTPRSRSPTTRASSCSRCYLRAPST